MNATQRIPLNYSFVKCLNAELFSVANKYFAFQCVKADILFMCNFVKQEVVNNVYISFIFDEIIFKKQESISIFRVHPETKNQKIEKTFTNFCEMSLKEFFENTSVQNSIQKE